MEKDGSKSEKKEDKVDLEKEALWIRIKESDEEKKAAIKKLKDDGKITDEDEEWLLANVGIKETKKEAKEEKSELAENMKAFTKLQEELDAHQSDMKNKGMSDSDIREALGEKNFEDFENLKTIAESNNFPQDYQRKCTILKEVFKRAHDKAIKARAAGNGKDGNEDENTQSVPLTEPNTPASETQVEEQLTELEIIKRVEEIKAELNNHAATHGQIIVKQRKIENENGGRLTLEQAEENVREYGEWYAEWMRIINSQPEEIQQALMADDWVTESTGITKKNLVNKIKKQLNNNCDEKENPIIEKYKEIMNENGGTLTLEQEEERVREYEAWYEEWEQIISGQPEEIQQALMADNWVIEAIERIKENRAIYMQNLVNNKIQEFTVKVDKLKDLNWYITYKEEELEVLKQKVEQLLPEFDAIKMEIIQKSPEGIFTKEELEKLIQDKIEIHGLDGIEETVQSMLESIEKEIESRKAITRKGASNLLRFFTKQSEIEQLVEEEKSIGETSEEEENPQPEITETEQPEQLEQQETEEQQPNDSQSQKTEKTGIFAWLSGIFNRKPRLGTGEKEDVEQQEGVTEETTPQQQFAQKYEAKDSIDEQAAQQAIEEKAKKEKEEMEAKKFAVRYLMFDILGRKLSINEVITDANVNQKNVGRYIEKYRPNIMFADYNNSEICCLVNEEIAYMVNSGMYSSRDEVYENLGIKSEKVKKKIEEAKVQSAQDNPAGDGRK